MSESNQPGGVVAENALVGAFRIRNTHIVVKVNSVNTVVSSAELDQLKREGYDLEAIGTECETGA